MSQNYGWPTYPKNHNPYFGDGKTYGKELGRVSPENNVYGQMRWIRDFVHDYFWDGFSWSEMECDYQVEGESLLPDPSTRPYLEVWRSKIINPNTGFPDWKYWFVSRDNDQNLVWKKVRWISPVEHPDDLPSPGWRIGDGCKVIEPDVLVMWAHYYWKRLSHRMLKDDQPERHLPAGFIAPRQSEAYLEYVNPTNLGIFPTRAGTGQVYVQGEYVNASDCSLLDINRKPLIWSGSALTQQSEVLPDHEYYIYLANTKSAEYAFSDFDYRGQLFLSLTPDVNGYLGQSGAGLNARRVGRVEVDSETPPHFRPEVDISEINRTTSFPETMREHSDFVLSYVDKDSLELHKLWGLKGQIYIGGNLFDLGDTTLTITRISGVVVWDANTAVLSFEQTSCSPNTLYHVYLASDLDPYNFNAINPETDRPWNPEDEGSESSYVAALDFRKKLFVSETEPDSSTGTLDGQFPAYHSRYIGKVWTDAYGYFIHARDISHIRQPTLNPSYLDGLAEISLVPSGSNNTEFCMIRRTGTSGIIQVCGKAVQTYAISDTLVHKISNSDLVSQYVEGAEDPILPWLNEGETCSLEDWGKSFGESNHLYVYLCNDDPVFTTDREKLIVCNSAPTGGYLSRNWPGNCARYVCTIRVNSEGYFPGGFILDAIETPSLRINDSAASYNETWSGAFINEQMNQVRLLISGSAVWDTQLEQGLNVQLEYVDGATVRLKSVLGVSTTVVFPNLSDSRSIPIAGINLDISSHSPKTSNTVWLLSVKPHSTNPDGLEWVMREYDSENYPFTEGQKLHYYSAGNEILVGYIGYTGDGTIVGTQNVCSFWNEPDRTWEMDINLVLGPASGAGSDVQSLPAYAEYGLFPYTNGTYSKITDVTLSIPGLVTGGNSKIIVERTGVTGYKVIYSVNDNWAINPQTPTPNPATISEGTSIQSETFPSTPYLNYETAMTVSFPEGKEHFDTIMKENFILRFLFQLTTHTSSSPYCQNPWPVSNSGKIIVTRKKR
jgi:hypothetical protein